MSEARTKILCTVGPACAGETILAQLMAAGADLFRVNGAHAKPEELRGWVELVRAASRRARRPASVLVDLPGTKLRVGELEGGQMELEAESRVHLVPDTRLDDPAQVPIRGIDDLSGVAQGLEVLLADGQIRMRVLEHKDKGLLCKVMDGGTLLQGKGVDFPGGRLETNVPTERDEELARAAVEAGVDCLALSFVRQAGDVVRLRKLLDEIGARHMPVIVKIEREDAVEALDSILAKASGVMVARGDLGVDVGPERVPSLQKQIIEMATRYGRPVIVATEMLESMVERPRPTRAEAGDVANAVFEGADGVMLSAETAVGENPVLVVRTMSGILSAAESDPHAPYAGTHRFQRPASLRGRPDQHVVHAAVYLAVETQADAIVVFTRTGASAFRLSKERPRAPIFAYTPTEEVCRRMTFAWGVRPRYLPMAEGTDATVARVVEELRETERLPQGSRAVLCMGSARDTAGTTTMIQLLTL
ncbi:MAG: pyruvate kinase [Planctomycetota bacterium]|nr:pyruvate kinase [Planctomycetota bacterium]